ncbi:Hypothetical protein Ccan_00650 [Capnocytophaga canimorsus Cc5]|uniref:Uncharacterized protein n=1 Tax=Capnocytophaga canimorsus (strain 5) TaxID=860228 RepID=F9YPU2_CAPCC|nr:Hypothetical protein Ccan_00650 [Capnocytophaga canimorsus Cc5]CEN43905.1 conserved hypothetical protein [Capnocytophaga canimorsus]
MLHQDWKFFVFFRIIYNLNLSLTNIFLFCCGSDFLVCESIKELKIKLLLLENTKTDFRKIK